MKSDIQMQIDPHDEALAKQAQVFRDELRPFGLDKFMLSDVPNRVLNVSSGRILAEFRTMLLPVWYPEKLAELKKAGFDVVTVRKNYTTRPPQDMYYVRTVREIWRKM